MTVVPADSTLLLPPARWPGLRLGSTCLSGMREPPDQVHEGPDIPAPPQAPSQAGPGPGPGQQGC